MGKSSWALVPATILLVMGILSYAFQFGIISWKSIYLDFDYLVPAAMIFVGLLILLSRLKKRK
jgi:hypothetical protein